MLIKKSYGSVGRYQVRLITWDAEDAKKVPGILFTGQEVLDIRCYEKDVPMQGITLNADMITSLYTILSRISIEVTEDEKKHPLKKGTQQGIDYTVYAVYGTLQIAPQYNVIVTTAKFGNEDADIVCDIRIWKKDLSGFSYGVSIPIKEFTSTFGEALIKASDQMNIACPRMIGCKNEVDPCAVSFNELVYQLDKTALCFGRGNEATCKKFYAETLDFIRNWGTGTPKYCVKRISEK